METMTFFVKPEVRRRLCLANWQSGANTDAFFAQKNAKEEEERASPSPDKNTQLSNNAVGATSTFPGVASQ